MEFVSPSALSPAPPAMAFVLPPGWAQRPHASAAFFAVDGNSPDGFAVNLVVLATRVLTDSSLDELVTALDAAPGAAAMAPELQGRRHESVAGHDAVLSAFTLRSPSLPFPLFQTRAALLVPGGVPHLVHAYATCPAASAERYAVVFRAIFAAMRVG
jgi:hypothetical protein